MIVTRVPTPSVLSIFSVPPCISTSERDSAVTKLRARYSAFDHPAAREIIDWLDGGYRITQEIMDTQ
ncbi:MAG: hypothetical protein Q7T44_10650 [Parvibaculum sp.]|nr:hypothetical protein [Parvibaculum sp.]